MSTNTVRVAGTELRLANSQTGQPIYRESTPEFFRPMVQSGEATSASFDPRFQGVYDQDDLSGGIGKRVQVPKSHADSRRVRYGENIDFGGYEIGPGPEVSHIDKLTNMGSLTGSFELGGNLYLVGSRIIAAYNAGAGTISEAEDLGAGVVGYGGATWLQRGAESKNVENTGDTNTDTLTSASSRIAQSFVPTVSGYITRVDAKLIKTEIVGIQQIALTGGPTGGTFTVTYGAGTSGGIAYNADAATVQTALRAVTGLGSVTVTKANSVAWNVTMAGVAYPVLAMTGDGASLTGGTNPNVTVGLLRAAQNPTGNIRLTLHADQDSQPAEEEAAISEKLAADLSTTATLYTFRYAEAERMYVEKGATYWIVADCGGATPVNTVGWRRDNTNPGGYTSGTGATSSDGGVTYTANANSTDHYFAAYIQQVTAASFIGKASGAKFLTTTDGATYVADATNQGKHFAVCGQYIIRDCQNGPAGAITLSTDGKNWDEPVPLSDPSVPVTAMVATPSAVIVVTENAIYGMDPSSTPVSLAMIYSGPRSTANGVGSYVWRDGTAYIPFNNRLMAIEGDNSSGFTRHLSVGPDSASEWEAPWGAGRVVAVAGDRHCLYAAMSTGSSYRLFKSYDPLNKRWVGSIADLGTPTTFTHMTVFDSGTTNPILFFSTTGNDLGKIVLPRTARPWSDTAYRVTTSTAKLFFPRATGNVAASLKAWISETYNFAQTAAGGYAEMLYDDGNGEGWRAVEGSERYETGIASYATGLSSLYLDRQLCLTSTSATSYPLLIVTALTYAVRSAIMRQYQFTVEVGDGMSRERLASLLNLSDAKAKRELFGAPLTGGTTKFTDPDGESHNVLFLTCNRTMAEVAKAGHSYYEIMGVEAA